MLSIIFHSRIQMPSMLASDNVCLQTWLSTRYATRNKSRTNQILPEANNDIRQERKKSSSERTTKNEDSDGFVDWLTPKRAKLIDSCPDASMEISSEGNMFLDDNRSKYRFCKLEKNNIHYNPMINILVLLW